MDVSGVVYMCDNDNDRIQLFVSMYLHCYSEFNVCPHMYYFSLHVAIYIVIVSLMSVHTCIILVSMYLHCYSEFNVSPHMYIIVLVRVPIRDLPTT